MLYSIIDFRFSRLLIHDVGSVHRSLHRVDVGSVADVSEIHASSIFRVEMSRAVECSCAYRYWSNRSKAKRRGLVLDLGQWEEWTEKCYQKRPWVRIYIYIYICIYIYMHVHTQAHVLARTLTPIHIDPEGRYSMYFRNVGKTAHINTV
jgi:hypothetical protein